MAKYAMRDYPACPAQANSSLSNPCQFAPTLSIYPQIAQMLADGSPIFRSCENLPSSADHPPDGKFALKDPSSGSGAGGLAEATGIGVASTYGRLAGRRQHADHGPTEVYPQISEDARRWLLAELPNLSSVVKKDRSGFSETPNLNPLATKNAGSTEIGVQIPDHRSSLTQSRRERRVRASQSRVRGTRPARLRPPRLSVSA